MSSLQSNQSNRAATWSWTGRTREFEEARGFGWSAQAPTLDWDALKRNRAVEIARLLLEQLEQQACDLNGVARCAAVKNVELTLLRDERDPCQSSPFVGGGL